MNMLPIDAVRKYGLPITIGTGIMDAVAVRDAVDRVGFDATAFAILMRVYASNSALQYSAQWKKMRYLTRIAHKQQTVARGTNPAEFCLAGHLDTVAHAVNKYFGEEMAACVQGMLLPTTTCTVTALHKIGVSDRVVAALVALCPMGCVSLDEYAIQVSTNDDATKIVHLLTQYNKDITAAQDDFFAMLKMHISGVERHALENVFKK